MWVQLCVSAWLSAAPTDGQALTPPPAAAKGDAGAMLKEKVAKLSELKSYAFEVVDDGAGGFGRRGGRGGGGSGDAPGAGAPAAPPAPTPTTAKVEVGKGVAFTRGETVAYRVDKKTVYKKGEAWELYVPFDFGAGRGGGGPPGGGGAPPGGAGGAPPAGGGAGGPPGAGGGPPGGGDFSGMRELMVVGGLANQTLPHELIASMPAKFHDVKCSEADGKSTFTGALSDEAADELSGAKRLREMFAGRGGGAGAGGATTAAGSSATITAKGTATIVFDAAGMPLQIVIETTTTGPRGDTPRKQAYTLKEFGAVKVEVPKEAAAKLAG